MAQYVMSIGVEARSTLELARTLIYPAVKRFQSNLATTETNLVALGLGGDTETLTRVTDLIAQLIGATAPLGRAIEGLPGMPQSANRVTTAETRFSRR